MSIAHYRQHILSNREMYLPYLYPLLMPILTLHAFKIPVHSFQEALTYWLFIGFSHLVLVVLIQKAVYSTTYRKPIRWLMAFFMCSLFIYFYFNLEYNYFHMTDSFMNLNKWVYMIRTTLNIPIIIALIEGVKSAAERKRLVIVNMMLENENAQAQLNLLLQQVNPHFLFNCLTILQAMVRAKDTRTEAFIVKLGDVYRQTLKKDKGTVTLKEELDFFNAYMYLMSLRQEKAIFVDVQVSDSALAYRLPVFALQLLAENCIKHNIVSASKPLTIRLYQKDAQSLTIENNFQPKKTRSESFGIGIKNLKKRYKLEGIKKGMLIEKSEMMYSTTLKLF